MPLTRLRSRLRRGSARIQRLLAREDRTLRTFPAQRSSIRRKILWQSLLLTGFTVAALSLLSVIVAHALIRNRVLGQLSSTVASRENLLSRSLEFDRERTALLAARDDMRTAFASRDAVALHEIANQLLREQVPVRGITLFDARGAILSRTGEASAAPSAALSSTLLVPVLAGGRWDATDVFTPVRSLRGGAPGILAIRYDPAPLLQTLSANPSLGATGEMILVKEEGGVASILYDYSGESARRSRDDAPVGQFVIPQAVAGKEGVFTGKDEWGEEVLAAYRFVPASGWGMVLKVDTSDALRGWEQFAYTLLGLDLFLLLLSGIVGITLARDLSAPILSLASKMRLLQPGRWEFRRSVHTGDEVELLDYVAAELTSRLRRTYEGLEEEVTERTQALRRQYELDRMILQGMEAGVIVTDAGGSIVDANPAALRMLQTDLGHLGRQTAVQAMALYRKDAILQPDKHPIARVLRTGEPCHARQADHLSLLAGDRSFLPILLTVTPLTVRKQMQGVIVLFQDIREEKRIEEMKSDFIALASHQLRTPLSSVRWYVELLRGERTPHLSDTQRSYVGQIEASAKRMAVLLEDLLHVTHIEGGEITPQKSSFNAVTMLRELADEWVLLAAQKKIRCVARLPRRVMKLVSDPVLLRLVLQNLFTNALKYSGTDSEIHVGMEMAGKHVTITMADAGMGIPAEEQTHVFQKFFRAKNARRVDADGTGLGLYLAKAIMENLGGHISFKSAPGRGTTFTVRVPVK